MITQLQPISVLFTLPQQQLAAGQARPSPRARSRSTRCGPDNKTVVDRGTLQVVDNQVDQTTGTVKLKAEFPNSGPAALAGPVRQRAAAGRHAERRGGGADRRGAARAERHVRLCGQRRQHRRDAPDHGAQQDETQTVVTSGVDPASAWSPRASRGSPTAARSPSAARAGAPAAAAPATTATQRPAPERRAADYAAMSVSAPFIHRPIATSLLGVAVLLGGALGYRGCRSRRCRRSTSPPSR